MNRNDAERIVERIKIFHRDTIAPLLNSSSLVVGSTYPCPIDVAGVGRAEFEVRPFGTASTVSAERVQPSNSRWALRIFPESGGQPFRIEDDNANKFAHVNTCNPAYDHVKLLIPQDKLTTYGIIGSAFAGYYEPECDKDLPDLLRCHFDSE